MSVSFAGFNMNALTFRCGAKISEGTPVKIQKSDYVTVCSIDEGFHGIAIDSDTKYVSVQLKGMATLNYTGTAPATGYSNLSANGLGGVQASASGNKYLVVSVNETAHTVTFLM